MMDSESFRFEEADSKNQKSSQQLHWEENNLKFDDLFSPDDFKEKDQKLNINNQPMREEHSFYFNTTFYFCPNKCGQTPARTL